MKQIDLEIARMYKYYGSDGAPFSWFGGKGEKEIRNTILKYVEVPAKIYCEPFCGAGSIFWSKRPHAIEVLNDLDKRIINIFRVLQDPKSFDEFFHRLTFTLYSRQEFVDAIELLKSDRGTSVERAQALFIQQNMAFGANPCPSGGSWRIQINPDHGDNGVTTKFRMKIRRLQYHHRRIGKAMIENRDAITVIMRYDAKTTVFYLDPPYVASTRKSGKYHHECDDAFHRKLIQTIKECKGRFILSGYDNPIYNNKFMKWDDIIRKKIPLRIKSVNADKQYREECIFIREAK